MKKKVLKIFVVLLIAWLVISFMESLQFLIQPEPIEASFRIAVIRLNS